MNYDGLRFLVIDDKLSMRKIISRELRSLGANTIFEAANGKEACDILERAAKNHNPIQFILSDWSMPEMEGIELLKFCRNHEAYKQVPFLLITAEASAARVKDAIDAGVDNYVVKPFTAAALGEKIRLAFERKAAKK